MGYENTQTYQVEVAILIEHQILTTTAQGNVWQLEERINNQILEVKGVGELTICISMIIIIIIIFPYINSIKKEKAKIIEYYHFYKTKHHFYMYMSNQVNLAL